MLEDDADERMALGRVLRASRFQVASYASAEEFLGSPRSAILCLLLDIQLEGDVRTRTAACPARAGLTVPVVIITASDDDDTSREAEILGCLAYLRKPFLGRSLVFAAADTRQRGRGATRPPIVSGRRGPVVRALRTRAARRSVSAVARATCR